MVQLRITDRLAEGAADQRRGSDCYSSICAPADGTALAFGRRGAQTLTSIRVTPVILHFAPSDPDRGGQGGGGEHRQARAGHGRPLDEARDGTWTACEGCWPMSRSTGGAPERTDQSVDPRGNAGHASHSAAGRSPRGCSLRSATVQMARPSRRSCSRARGSRKSGSPWFPRIAGCRRASVGWLSLAVNTKGRRGRGGVGELALE